MNRLLYLLIVSLLFTGIASKAQAEETLPASFQGYWAHPDCSDYAEGAILTRHFYLKSTETGSIFRIAKTVAEKKDYTILDLGGQKHPVLRSEDSLLRIGTMGAGAAWSELWDDLPLLGRNEYTGCTDAPTVIPVPLVRVMKSIDALYEACGARMTSECNGLLFTFADSNGNKRLSTAEFKKLGAMAQTFAALLEKDSVPTEDLEAAYMQGIGDGQEMAEVLLVTLDKDRSGDLTRHELSDMTKAQSTPAFNKNIGLLARLFAGFEN